MMWRGSVKNGLPSHVQMVALAPDVTHTGEGIVIEAFDV
jgi:hypothetical protein